MCGRKTNPDNRSNEKALTKTLIENTSLLPNLWLIPLTAIITVVSPLINEIIDKIQVAILHALASINVTL
jgi:hypothetical protein